MVGINDPQGNAATNFLSRAGATEAELRAFIEQRFAYDLSRHVDEIRPDYRFNESSQETVPQAIRAFLDSTDFEDALKTAISLGDDSDALTCLFGGIAQADYDVAESVGGIVFGTLDGPPAEVAQEFLTRLCGSDRVRRKLPLAQCFRAVSTILPYKGLAR